VGKKHGPNRLSNYLETHDTVMQQFVTRGFVLSNELSFWPYGQGLFVLAGDVRCLGHFTLRIAKVLEVVGGEPGNRLVQTAAYSYNGFLEGLGNILRYDSPHDPAHRPFHHVHRYRVLEGDTDGTVEEIAEDAWPTIGDVLMELEEFYYENFGRLPQE
jgi:hypothetical protein